MSTSNQDLQSLFLGDGKFDNELDEIFKAAKTEFVPVQPQIIQPPVLTQDNETVEEEAKVVEEGVEISLDTQTKFKVMKPGKDDLERKKRTIFISNVSVEALTKAGRKILMDTFKKFGKLDSIRFRSLALEKPMNRKAAYIKKKLHPKRSTVNCYLVFEDEESVQPSLELNGTVLFEKHIRVDRNDLEKVEYPKKRSVFVGNLPFEVEEEPLWQHFATCGKVEGVRVIRDNQTNLGKGFAYVLFQDEAAAQLALKLHDSKFEKRKLRVSKCTSAYKSNQSDPSHKKLKLKDEIILEGERASKKKLPQSKRTRSSNPQQTKTKPKGSRKGDGKLKKRKTT